MEAAKGEEGGRGCVGSREQGIGNREKEKGDGGSEQGGRGRMQRAGSRE